MFKTAQFLKLNIIAKLKRKKIKHIYVNLILSFLLFVIALGSPSSDNIFFTT